MADHALVFLGVEMDGWRFLPAMKDHTSGQIIPRQCWVARERPTAFAVCSCGEWDSALLVHQWFGVEAALAHAEDDHARHAVAARRRAEEAALTDAACLYCFAPLDKPGYCSEQHRLADRVRVPGDIREGVLDEFREAPVASPDQMEMW